jgi:proteasome-associated ATPase
MTVRNKLTEELPEILHAPPELRKPLLESLLRDRPQLGPPLALTLLDRHLQAEQAAETCQAQLTELKGLIDELTAPPLLLGAVAAAGNGHCLVAVGNSRQQVKADPRLQEQLQCGDIVTLSHEGNVILEHLPDYRPPGKVATVRGGKLLVEHASDQALALDPSPAVEAARPRQGDRVLYHDQWMIALEVVDKPELPNNEPIDDVGLDDIGGLDDQIDELLLLTETQFLYPEKAAALDLKPLGGFVLDGCPGVGKTLLIKGLATWLRKQHGRRVLFLSVAPGSWRDPFYGMSERRLVEPLQEARRLLADGQVDLVILFYDEIDTLGTRSGDVTNRIDSRVLTPFLTELDGIIGRRGILVCGATNRLDMVDEALLRPGRFGDRIIAIPRPNREAARSIFRCHLKPSVQFWSNGEVVPPPEMVDRCIDSALAVLFKETDPADALAELTLAGGQRHLVWPRQALSGAVISNIVQGAKQLALRRSLIGPGGLAPLDLAQAAEKELAAIARRMQDPVKAREMLADLALPIARVSPGRLGRTENGH